MKKILNACRLILSILYIPFALYIVLDFFSESMANAFARFLLKPLLDILPISVALREAALDSPLIPILIIGFVLMPLWIAAERMK